MKIFDRLQVTVLFLRLVRNPQRTDLIFQTINLLSRDRREPSLVEIERRMMADDRFRVMYEERYLPPAPPLAQLGELPEGTFGRAFHRHMTANHLDPNLFPRFEARAVIDYMSVRIYQDHDLWHTLLDLGVSVEDELALQAFGVAQFHSPIGALLIAGGLLNLLRTDPRRAVLALAKIVDGYEKGRKARFLLAERLHELFPRPLKEVRQELGLAA